MTEVLDPAAKVYQGVWRDWSKDHVRGLTWTLSQDKANLLSNILTLFIALVAGQAWAIVRYALHQTRRKETDDPNDVHLQQRVVLRNAASDLHTLRLMIKVAWRTRRRLQSSFSYPFAIAALAIAHYAMFILAQTFLSSLVSASSTVLAVSPDCGGGWSSEYLETMEDGAVNISSLETIGYGIRRLAKRQHDVQLSLEYAQECYETNPRFSTVTPSCKTMKKSHLDFQLENSAGFCPFGPNMCHPEQQSITFTTQRIDSHHDLGLNSPEADRLLYRRQTTCAVLNSSYITEEGTGSPNATAYANYGTSVGQETDYTYSTSNFSGLYTNFTVQDVSPYRLNAQFAYAASPHTEGWSCFNPIPPLAEITRDSDLTLLFLSYTGRYFTPIDDPWFSAHNIHQENTESPLARTQYSRDTMISTLGCKERHEFCKPSSDEECTPFLGWGQVQEPFSSSLRPLQKVIFERMLQAVDESSLAMVAMFVGMTSTPLLANDQCAAQSTVMSIQVPNDQWKLEMQYWYSLTMAALQRNLVQWATGRISGEPTTQLRPPETTEERWFCENLLIPSEVYQSFSVLGVVLITSFGVLIIIVASTVERMTTFLRKWNGQATNRASWNDQDVLNLFDRDEKCEKGPLPPPKDFHTVKDLESGRLQTAQINTPQRAELPPGYRSFDSRCSTLRSEMEMHYHHAPPQKNELPVSNNTPSSWMDQHLSDEKALPATPITPRQVFETWRHERRSKRHGYQV